MVEAELVDLGELKSPEDAQKLRNATAALVGVKFDPRSVEGLNCVHGLASVVAEVIPSAPRLSPGGYVSAETYMEMLSASQARQRAALAAEPPDALSPPSSPE
ncbi:hypothetical protein [Ramlibacter sp.]|uniref:hypothetical protein n=1 Tax=Ramlibacter sp. TaxID=1917967 RepID=UPI003D1016D8